MLCLEPCRPLSVQGAGQYLWRGLEGGQADKEDIEGAQAVGGIEGRGGEGG